MLVELSSIRVERRKQELILESMGQKPMIRLDEVRSEVPRKTGKENLDFWREMASGNSIRGSIQVESQLTRISHMRV